MIAVVSGLSACRSAAPLPFSRSGGHYHRGMIELTLAHSPDPDDVFMWWPITGKIAPGSAHDHSVPPRQLSGPVLPTGRFRFRPVPADIEVLNRRALDPSATPYDVTALSVRTWADVSDRYRITRCGASFGDGFGPKLVCRRDQRGETTTIGCEGCLLKPGVTIAIPGRRTTAFLMLGMVLGRALASDHARFVEMPFDQIIPAVASRKVHAGLVIHEGQLTFADAGLRLLVDVGEWWKERTGLKLPLGINAVRTDLDSLHGPGTLAEVGDLLAASVKYAMERREESTAYTMPWAEANAVRAGMATPDLARVDRYCRMYVSEETLDMGEAGRAAIERLLREGESAGLVDRAPSVSLL